MKIVSAGILVAFFVAILNSPVALAEAASANDVACERFESLRNDYTQSLGKDETGKPTASGQSVALAWDLTGAAADCLAERGVAFE